METKNSSSKVSSNTKVNENNENIQVFIRVRPLNAHEVSKNAVAVIDTPGSREVVVRERSVSNVTKTFAFDKVFGVKSKQEDVYESVASPLVSEVLMGYNCTIFAYGQTGTGKTYTMEGDRSRKSETGEIEINSNAGILPRALSKLFDELSLMNCEFTARVSLLELYNEELFDLLAPMSVEEISKAKTLRLFEDSNRKGSVIIQGLEEMVVTNKQEVYALMDRGNQHKKTAATLMNATSSRSHTIFTITLHIKETTMEGEEMLKVGKMNLVDLAGSENIGKSGAVDMRAREAGSINQSLLTLGRVITALVERTPHVPYRESKLTRLLQDSLGGKTKTSIIATISPASVNIEETLNTLDYAHRAKNIMNRPEINQRLTKRHALHVYTHEIERLRRDLNATRGKHGVFMDYKSYNRIIKQINSQNQELNDQANRIQELEELKTTKEEEVERVHALEMEHKQDLDTQEFILSNLQREIMKLEKELAYQNNKENELLKVIEYHEATEVKISGEAQELLTTANDNCNYISNLHDRLDRKQSLEKTNICNGKILREGFNSSADNVVHNLKGLKEMHTNSVSHLRVLLRNHNLERNMVVNHFTGKIMAAASALDSLQEQIKCISSAFENPGHEKLLQKITASDLKFMGRLYDHLDEQTDKMFTETSGIASTVSQMSESTEEFWVEKYLVDHPSGGTPMRRKFDYPKTLSVPSPYEMIVAQLRNTQEVHLRETINEEVIEDDNEADTARTYIIDKEIEQLQEEEREQYHYNEDDIQNSNVDS